MALYHPEVYMPEWLRDRVQGLAMMLRYSPHARSEAADDGVMDLLPVALDTRVGYMVEAETDGAKLVKLVWRQALDAARDIVLVVLPDTRVVKTVWTNATDDVHATLNPNRYDME